MWDKPEEATLLMKKINDIESELNDYNSLLKELRELRFMVELSEEYGDEKEYTIELKKLKNLERRVVDYSYSQMLTGEYDTGDAVVQIHSGAGGLEAQDWAEMLYRMYQRWSQ